MIPLSSVMLTKRDSQLPCSCFEVTFHSIRLGAACRNRLAWKAVMMAIRKLRRVSRCFVQAANNNVKSPRMSASTPVLVHSALGRKFLGKRTNRNSEANTRTAVRAWMRGLTGISLKERPSNESEDEWAWRVIMAYNGEKGLPGYNLHNLNVSLGNYFTKFRKG